VQRCVHQIGRWFRRLTFERIWLQKIHKKSSRSRFFCVAYILVLVAVACVGVTMAHFAFSCLAYGSDLNGKVQTHACKWVVAVNNRKLVV
jgi:hypothetical protein